MSLKDFTFSTVNLQGEAKWAGLAPELTKDPRCVHRSWHIPNRRKPLMPSKNGVHKDSYTSRECSEVILHG